MINAESMVFLAVSILFVIRSFRLCRTVGMKIAVGIYEMLLFEEPLICFMLLRIKAARFLDVFTIESIKRSTHHVSVATNYDWLALLQPLNESIEQSVPFQPPLQKFLS